MRATPPQVIDRQARLDTRWSPGGVAGVTARGTFSEVENGEYADMLARMLRAFGHRVAGGDVEDLATLLELGRFLDAVTLEAVKGLREDQGYSWADIARAAGTTRQACHERWGP